MHGLQPGTWNGWFGGRSIASVKQQRPPFYRINYPMKQLMFSAHHLKADTVHLYVEQLQKRRITWLHGYPSQISLLASLMKQAGLIRVLPDLKIITTGSENLLETQQNIIAEVLGAPVVQHYGLAEGASNISQHPDGSLRPDQDFAYTEFIPLNEENPELCRIIGTNYHNPAFPLLRYDTGDLARIRWENGVPVVLSIDGRQEDYITLPDGLKLGRLDHIFKKITEVREAQIYQPETGRVVLRIVKNTGYDAAGQEKMLLAETRKRLGNSIHIEIEYLDAIPRTKSGKLRFVISAVSGTCVFEGRSPDFSVGA
jgi:phenylacetate-CoA ligase